LPPHFPSVDYFWKGPYCSDNVDREPLRTILQFGLHKKAESNRKAESGKAENRKTQQKAKSANEGKRQTGKPKQKWGFKFLPLFLISSFPAYLVLSREKNDLQVSAGFPMRFRFPDFPLFAFLPYRFS